MTDIGTRARELLAAEATEGLSAAERAELERLLEGRADHESASFAAAAAAIELAHGGLEAPMPSAVRQQARARLLAEIDAAHAAKASAQAVADSRADQVTPLRRPARAAGRRRSGRLGWLLSAAALLLAAIGWWPQPLDDALLPIEARRSSPDERRTRLLATAADAVTLPWQATEDPAAVGAAGDVVWSTRRQTGFMRLTGLPVNDPSAYQYQLWIFDAERDDRYPVDGGVFDVGRDGEVVVPIDPRLTVDRATLFAVTIEQPGGVVVSGRDRLVLLAQCG